MLPRVELHGQFKISSAGEICDLALNWRDFLWLFSGIGNVDATDREVVTPDPLSVIKCGFLLPVTIEAGEERKFSATYMLRGSLPEVFVD